MLDPGRQALIQKNKALKQALAIEASLNRIRNLTMEMESSEDLSDVIRQVFQEAIELGFGARACDLVILDRNTGGSQFWISGNADKGEVIHFIVPKLSIKHYLDGLEAWKKRRAVRYKHLKGRSCQAYMRQLTDNMKHSNMPKKVVRMLRKLTSIHHTEAYMRYGFFRVASDGPLEKDQIKILRRFAKVFEQSYTRYLNLHEAEAQAREAQIEVALERVRGRTMIMRRSSELAEVAAGLFEEVQDLYELGSNQFRCWIVIADEQVGVNRVWSTDAAGDPLKKYSLMPIKEHPVQQRIFGAWKEGQASIVTEFTAAQAVSYTNYLAQFEGYRDDAELRQRMQEYASPEFLTRGKNGDPIVAWMNEAFFSQGRIGFLVTDQHLDLDLYVLERFATVFEQSYTRFLDLQKAEAQAREAQIEAALERVRARSMAMHSSEELVEVATVLYNELRSLDVREFSDASIVIFDESNNQQIVWGARTESDFLEKAVMPLLGDEVLQELYDKWHLQDPFFTVEVGGKALQKHLNFVVPKAGRTEIEDRALKNMPDPTFFHCAAFSWGYLELVAEKELSEDSSLILTRFARVFEQCYTRFLDLQKAERQAREAQIEAALERIRTSAMMMTSPDDLINVVRAMREQMELLKEVGLETTVVQLWNEGSEISENWYSFKMPGDSSASIVEGIALIPKYSSAFARVLTSQYELGTPEFTITSYGEMLTEWYGVLEEFAPKVLTYDAKEELIIPDQLHYHYSRFTGGALVMISEELPSDNSKILLKRAAYVFELAYKRFLDLQRAEEQAREAQIEAALERVRARTMAMHHSDELGDAAILLYQQLIALGIDQFFICGFVIVDEEHKIQNGWLTQPDGSFVEKMNLPLPGDSVLKERYQAWKNNVPVFHQLVGGARLKRHLTYVADRQLSKNNVETILPIMPDPVVFYCGNFSEGYLHILAPAVLKQESEEVLARFTAVFEMTYRRFLDLRKAEAQTREAQIEAALERVRAASMAMHHTSELQKVINTVGEQFRTLRIDNTGGVFICINEENAEEICVWGSGDTAEYASRVCVPKLDRPIYTEIIKKVKQGPGFVTEIFSREEKIEFFKHMFKYPPYNQTSKAHQKEWLARKGGYTRSCAISRHTTLFMINHHGRVFSEDENDILKRFGRVFEQSYVRFLDLQKAEAQAREAQIEASLERVRAASLAMHHTEDIAKVVTVLFDQLKGLNLDFIQTWITIFELDHEKINVWFSQYPGVNDEPVCIVFPSVVFAEAIEAWKVGEPFWYRTFANSEEVDAFLTACGQFAQTDYFDKLNAVLEVECLEFIETRHDYGNISKSGTTKPTEDEKILLQRFGRVFAQAYTRFLDLQKAEAQAREAQVEAALERVRAKAMAMHSSEDLTETIKVFYNQIGALINIPRRCGVAIIDESEGVSEVWTMNTTEEGESIDVVGSIKMEGHPVLENVVTYWKNQEDYFPILRGKEITDYYKVLHPQIEFPDYPHDEIQYGHYFMFPEGDVYAWTENELKEEDLAIYRRFTSVLSLTYRRYFDLQRAEAQAREAQIEAALERVRAVSLAMHQSEELQKVITTVFDQLKSLGISMDVSFIEIFDETRNTNMWVANPRHKYAQLVRIPYFKNPLLDRMLEARLKGETFFVDRYGKGVKNRFYRKVFKDSDLRVIPPHLQGEILKRKGYARSVALSKYAALAIFNLDDRPYNEEENQILRRFSRVFEQAYTRFLDLQKAEEQAREAQIEAALERVRAASMAMHRSDEMQQVVNDVYEQLQALGIEMDAVGMSGVIESQKDYDVWVGGSDFSEPLKIPFNDATQVQRDYNEIIEKRQELFARTYSGRIKKEYIDHLIDHGDFPEELKRRMLESEAFSTSISFYQNSGIQIVRYNDQPYTDQENEILCRFARVFEQAYIRFLDLQKAEAQAKEAQVEAALERLRSRSMAMHQSDELKEVVVQLFQGLDQLHIHTAVCNLALFDPVTKEAELWSAHETAKGLISYYVKVPWINHPIWKGIYDTFEKGQRFAVHEVSTSRRKGFSKIFFEKVDYRHAPEEVRKANQELPKVTEAVVLSVSAMKHGLLVASRNTPLAQEEGDILARFAKVFEQAYTRFLDLQKAEAQAREAEIEASLERVRSRTMAMHKSHELMEIVHVVHDELIDLGIDLEVMQIYVHQPGQKYFKAWMAVPGTPYPAEIIFPYFDNPWLKAVRRAQKRQETLVRVFQKQAKNAFYRAYFKVASLVPPSDRQKQILDAPAVSSVFTFSPNTGLAVLRFREQEFDVESISVVERFAAVFEQSYTRFLDLQKAEAQAREAQIEAALERVRARSMAMHASKDLHEVVLLLYEQLESLGLVMNSVMLHEFVDDTKDLLVWGAANGQLYPEKVWVPYLNHRWFNRFHKARTTGGLFITDSFSKAEKDKWFDNYFKRSTHQSVPESRKEFIYSCPGMNRSSAIHKNTALTVMLYDKDAYSEDDNEIIRRFGKVFEQSYTRFLDLQKAEEQGREAEIQLALERVRARTMAMHRGDELAETALVLFDQLIQLGFTLRGCGFLIMDESSKTMEDWSANLDEHGQGKIITGTLTFDIHPILEGVVDTWRKGESYYIGEVHGAELQEYYKAVTLIESVSQGIKDSVLASAISEWTNSFYFEYGMMYALTPHPLTEEEIGVMLRFAGVFKDTYRRFLDLKKAEAQAREAQIEAALERVRARSMAMHKSEELNQVIATVFEQLQILGFEAIQCEIILFDPQTLDCEIWPSNEAQQVLPRSYFIPHTHHAFYQFLVNAWQTQSDYCPYELKGRVKRAYEKWLFNQTDWQHIPREVKQSMLAIKRVMLYGATMRHGILEVAGQKTLSEEYFKIIKRFAKVFEQVYTRFLDLQKAEAQARESEIQLALERIRARSLAMHQSEELTDVISELFKQFDILAINPAFAHLTLFDGGSESFTLRLTDTSGERVMAEQRISLKHMPEWIEAYEGWKDGKPGQIGVIRYRPEDLPFVFGLLKDLVKAMPARSRIKAEKYPEGLWTVQGHCQFGYLGMNTARPPTDEDKDIVQRFAKEFARVYQRFIDLQRVEAQAREAQIQAALERVRAAAMAMHHSADLIKVAKVLREQMGQLGQPELESSIIHLYPEGRETFEAWWAFRPPDDIDGLVKEGIAIVPSKKTAWARAVMKYYQSDQSEYTIFSKGKMLKEWYRQLEEIAPSTIDYDNKGKIIVPKQLCYHFSKFSGGALLLITSEEPDQESCELQRRAAAVFELAYTRYLDLRKAEAQAREARIEAALERVRSKTMAMHHSEQLPDTASVVFEQLLLLGNVPDRICITIFKEEEGLAQFYVTDQAGSEVSHVFDVSIEEPTTIKKIYDAWQRKEKSVRVKLTGQELKDWIRYVVEDVGIFIDESNITGVRFHHAAFFSQGFLLLTTHEPIDDNLSQLLTRFAKVFDQTYTRFLDLKKAEEQAREARIEAALERVRAQTMAMHNSQDVSDTTMSMFDELESIGIRTVRCGVLIIKENNLIEVWAAASRKGRTSLIGQGLLDTSIHPLLRGIYTNWEQKSGFYEYDLKGKDLRSYYQALKKADYNIDLPHKLPPRLSFRVSYFPEGALFSFTREPFSDEGSQIFSRFAGVFALTYRRFLDLQRAEAQAREAQIEASLERVRARTMAMHDSEDIGDTVVALFSELLGLGISDKVRCGIGIFDNTDVMELWTAAYRRGTEVQLSIGHLDMTLHPVLRGAKQAWKDQKESFLYELMGDDMIRYFEVINSAPDYPVTVDLETLTPLVVHQSFMFPNGLLYAFSEEHLPNDVSNTLKRFAAVFGQTYQRYIDLQKAEAQAREATKNAAIDRVRAEIASMRTTEDLQRITPLIWRELTTLEVPFIRCGVFIIDDQTETTRTYLSTPGGKSLAVMDLGFDNPLVRPAVQHWRQNKVYKEEWDKNQFVRWTQSLIEQGIVKSSKKYQGGEDAPEHLVLHFVPFAQGMMYVGSPDFLDKTQIELVEALADAFAVAYARYEDFNQLEAAKERVEDTLDELKAAQNQLIHSEKMASLGELTAGIAHEIQNPLNFVNNFSDVNSELIEEMLEEIKAGNFEEAIEIAHDIEGNEQKIKHHGKRAEAIVRSMLQHSRSSSTHKELTDINDLADEYLRLAYHGMRAKDKSFNASMKTDFDKTLDKIEVVPQEIGRVLLNLITNAFHAVNEKKMDGENGYEPNVTVTTKKSSDKVLIRVKDNGSGIPRRILDKIFQPFFTTKPTGQGTGLGLSLSYDIVKVHKGDLKVETKEGEGTEFIVELPMV